MPCGPTGFYRLFILLKTVTEIVRPLKLYSHQKKPPERSHAPAQVTQVISIRSLRSFPRQCTAFEGVCVCVCVLCFEFRCTKAIHAVTILFKVKLCPKSEQAAVQVPSVSNPTLQSSASVFAKPVWRACVRKGKWRIVLTNFKNCVIVCCFGDPAAFNHRHLFFLSLRWGRHRQLLVWSPSWCTQALKRSTFRDICWPFRLQHL